MAADEQLLKAAASLLGCEVEELGAIAKEWGCTRNQVADMLVEAAGANESLRATRELSEDEELEANAAAAGVTVAELLQTAADWNMTPGQAAASLVERLRIREESARRSPAAAPRPKKQATRVLADAKEVLAAAQSGTRAASLDQSLKHGLKQLPRPAGRPPGASYRSQVLRRVSDPLQPPLWFHRFGAHASQVHAWLRDWKRLDNPVERAIVACLRAEMYHRGKGFPAIFPIASLAFQLWFESRLTARAGYCAHLHGVPRGELARRMAHKNLGTPVDPDTISRYLVELGRVLGGGRGDTAPSSGGLLEWEQPRPEAALREGLHKSTHYMADGTRNTQATNLYWWRDAAWVAKQGFDADATWRLFEGRQRDLPHANGKSHSALEEPSPVHDALEKMRARSRAPHFAGVVDPRTGYPTDKADQRVSPQSSDSRNSGAESSPTVPTRSGRPRAPSVSPRARGQPP